MKLLSLLAVPVMMWAQVNGPTPGYVFGKSELRPIRGTAGASYLGNALLKGADAVSVSPDGVSAAVARGGKLELVRGFDTASPVTAELMTVEGDVLLGWSGSTLTAYSASARKALSWKDGVASGSFDLAEVNGVRALALDGDNLWVASTSGLYVAARGGAAKRVADLVDPNGVVALNGDAYVSDAGANLVLRARGGEAQVFAAVAKPVGLLLGKNRLLVASAQSRSVEVFDMAGTRTGGLDLDFTPTRLQAIGARSLALLNEGSQDEPLFVLDSRDVLSAYFVPAGREE